jgi:hypothetical protein
MKYLLLFLLVACGSPEKSSDLEYHENEDGVFNRLVNSRNLENPSVDEDIFLINRDYPIEVAVYKDGRFYYNLENLGDGTGKWKDKKGALELITYRNIVGFNVKMEIYIQSNDPTGSSYTMKFYDRHGEQTLPLEIVKKQK